MREKTIVAAILRELRTSGAWAQKIHGAAYNAGLPDVAAVLDGRALWLEVKVPGGKATVLQGMTLERIREAGGVAAVVSSVDEVRELIREVRR
jgi:hypothetical protein